MALRNSYQNLVIRFASILLIAFFSQSLIQLFHIVHFEINKTEIIKTSCVQKDAVKNCCQGSCHINAKLKFSKPQESTETDAQPVVIFPEVFKETIINNLFDNHSFSCLISISRNIIPHFFDLDEIDPPPPKYFS